VSKKELKRAKEFLDFFSVDYKGDVIYLTDGGNSCIMNMKTEWQEFLGASVNGVAEAVAKKLNKTVKWVKN